MPMQDKAIISRNLPQASRSRSLPPPVRQQRVEHKALFPEASSKGLVPSDDSLSLIQLLRANLTAVSWLQEEWEEERSKGQQCIHNALSVYLARLAKHGSVHHLVTAYTRRRNRTGLYASHFSYARNSALRACCSSTGSVSDGVYRSPQWAHVPFTPQSTRYAGREGPKVVRTPAHCHGSAAPL